MARPAKGSVVVDTRGDVPRYGLRFRANGKRCFESLGEVSEAEANETLEKRLAEVRLGIYKPPTKAPVVEVTQEEPTFWVFAREWFEARQAEGLSKKTIADFEWSLNRHLVWFGHHRLSEITVQEVDRYKTAKTQEREAVKVELEAWLEANPKTRGPRPRPLSNSSINHTLRHLAQILETAVEYGHIPANPATGRRRRLKADTPKRPWVEPEQLMMFLDSAPAGAGRILLAILAGAGLRIGEALNLRWRDIDLGTGTLYVRAAKTEAGVREVHLSPALREELTVWNMDTSYPAKTDHVIPTATGNKHNPSNLRRDVLAPTVKAANAKLEAAGIAPIEALTFHGLRRTYASLRCVCGDDVRYTADQLGHEDPRFTLRCYAKASKRRDRMAKPQRDAFDAAIHWAAMGSESDLTVPELRIEATKNPV